MSGVTQTSANVFPSGALVDYLSHKVANRVVASSIL